MQNSKESDFTVDLPELRGERVVSFQNVLRMAGIDKLPGILVAFGYGFRMVL